MGYTRKEILGLLKMLGKLITDKGRAYDKRLHFGEVNGKYYAVRLPEGTVADRNENVKIVLPLLGKEESENMGADEKAICKFCMMEGKAMVVSENCIVGHLSYGPQHSVMERYYHEHRNLFDTRGK